MKQARKVAESAGLADIARAGSRPDPHVEADLRWYFQAAAGEMGLRSNWEAYANQGIFLTRLRSTFSVDAAKFTPDLRGAHRATPIARALAELSSEQRGVLFAAYADLTEVMKAWPGFPANQRAELVLAFRDLAGVAPFAAAEEHRRSRTARPVVEWLLRLSKRSRHDPVAARAQAAVIREAEIQLAAAVRAFTSARRLGRR